jgi:hypothetical protein
MSARTNTIYSKDSLVGHRSNKFTELDYKKKRTKITKSGKNVKLEPPGPAKYVINKKGKRVQKLVLDTLTDRVAGGYVQQNGKQFNIPNTDTPHSIAKGQQKLIKKARSIQKSLVHAKK